MTSAFTHLECSVPCGAGPYDPSGIHHLCACGMPLVARYDLEALRRTWSRDSLAGREPTMWRYREVMPLLAPAGVLEGPVSLGEGWTPLLRADRLGRSLGLDRLLVKDELSIPTAGNAGNAMAAYASRAGLESKVFMPKDVKSPFIRECLLYGADVTLVDGLITDAGRIAAETGKPLGWYDVSTLKEPYRIEGKKTMGYELAEQLDWELPDWIIYPTGGGTGMVGMWKAFAEMSALGWIDQSRRPHMVTVQAAGCAPIIRAFGEGAEKAAAWENAHTIADGLRVPKAIGDFLVLRAVRESDGAAVAVEDADMVTGMRDLGRLEGVSAAPEGGAALHALRVLIAQGRVKRHETVVLFNTGGALKYLDVLG
jgi:threonine synthase